MSDRVTPIRRDPGAVGLDVFRTPLERIVDLQKALKAEVGLMEANVMGDLLLVQRALDDAVSHIDHPGVRDEFRRLAETIQATSLRIDALRSR